MWLRTDSFVNAVYEEWFQIKQIKLTKLLSIPQILGPKVTSLACLDQNYISSVDFTNPHPPWRTENTKIPGHVALKEHSYSTDLAIGWLFDPMTWPNHNCTPPANATLLFQLGGVSFSLPRLQLTHSDSLYNLYRATKAPFNSCWIIPIHYLHVAWVGWDN